MSLFLRIAMMWFALVGFALRIFKGSAIAGTQTFWMRFRYFRKQLSRVSAMPAVASNAAGYKRSILRGRLGARGFFGNLPRKAAFNASLVTICPVPVEGIHPIRFSTAMTRKEKLARRRQIFNRDLVVAKKQGMYVARTLARQEFKEMFRTIFVRPAPAIQPAPAYVSA